MFEPSWKKSLPTLKPGLELTQLTEKASIILVLSEDLSYFFLSCLFLFVYFFPTVLGLLIQSNYEENNLLYSYDQYYQFNLVVEMCSYCVLDLLLEFLLQITYFLVKLLGNAGCSAKHYKVGFHLTFLTLEMRVFLCRKRTILEKLLWLYIYT